VSADETQVYHKGYLFDTISNDKEKVNRGV
jgi:hypothetical protein